MKKNILTASIIIMVVAFSIPVSGQFQSAEKKSDKLKDQVQALSDKMARASVNGDTKTVYSLYADDVVYMPNYGPMIMGKDNMIAYENKMKESGAKMTSMTLTTKEVVDMGTMVYEIGVYSISMEIPGMNQPWADKGKYVTIYRKTKGGGLEAVVDIWNTDVNPWKEMQSVKNDQVKEKEKAPLKNIEEEDEEKEE